jgi:hypothetical protein
MTATLTPPKDLKRLTIVLTTTWINGNRSDVIDEIVALPGPQAAVLTSLLTDSFRARGLRSDSAVLRKLLGNRLE